jgi:hypothetical protein
MQTKDICERSPQLIDLTGQKFNRLTVISFAGRIKGYSNWNCLCECGNTTITPATRLKRGTTKSCGCYAKEIHGAKCKSRATHNRSHSRLHRIWSGMKNRCSNPNDPGFKYYGERGVKVCERWKDSFANFAADMGEPPTEKHSIERIDNEKDYCPENCKWATVSEQNNNRRNTRFVTFNDQTKPLADWCRELGLPYFNTHRRIFVFGWTVDRAFTATGGK